MRKYIKSKTSILLFVVFFLLGLWRSFSIKLPNQIDMVDGQSFNMEDITYISGYDIEGDKFVPNNSDPQIDFNNLNRTISSVQVILKETATENIFVQVYYAVPDVYLQEINSVCGYIKKGTNQILIVLPENLYREIRFDINGSFLLEQINWSEKPVSIEKNLELSDFIVAFLIACAMALMIPWVIVKVKSNIQKLWACRNNENQFDRIMIGITILGLVIWLTFFCISLLSLEPLGKKWYSIFFLSTLVEIVCFLVVFRKKVAFHPEYIFLTICLLAGSYLSVSLPQGEVSWDDRIHYRNAVAVSHFYSQQATSAECCYFTLSSINVSDSVAVSEWKKELDKFYQQPSVSEVSRGHLYNSLCHMPAGFMMFIGRLFEMPAHSFFYMGRLGMVLLYAFLIYAAMKKLKSGKMILAVIALIPTNLFLISSYSYDPWVTGFSILGLSYIISELQQPEKRISKKEVVIMLGAFLLMGSAKAIYFPLAALAFLINKNKFASKEDYKHYCWCVAGTIAFLILSFVIPLFITQSGSLSDMRGGSGVNGKEQILFILKHPFQYAWILLGFLKDYLSISTSKEFMTFFYIYIPSGVKLEVFLLLLGIVTVTDKNDFDQNIKYSVKWITYGIVIITVVLVATSLYIAFTSVGFGTINGCQPRYLMPILFPVLIMAGSGRIVNQINKTYYNLAVYGVALYVIFASFWRACVGLYT